MCVSSDKGLEHTLRTKNDVGSHFPALVSINRYVSQILSESYQNLTVFQFMV